MYQGLQLLLVFIMKSAINVIKNYFFCKKNSILQCVIYFYEIYPSLGKKRFINNYLITNYWFWARCFWPRPGPGWQLLLATSIKIAHFVLICKQTWPPQAILVSDWLISKKSSHLKPLSQMNWNLVESIYGRSSIQNAHFVPIH